MSCITESMAIQEWRREQQGGGGMVRNKKAREMLSEYE